MTRDFENDVLAQRAGASNRTADELASVFIDDVVCIIRGLKVDGQPIHMEDQSHIVIPADVQAAMADADAHGWCDNADNGQLLSDFIHTAESWLGDFGMMVVWDDGYNIYDTTDWSDADWDEVSSW